MPLDPLSHSRVLGSLDSLRRIIRVIRLSSRRAERQFGVGGAQLFVLQQLAAASARSINELAARTFTHQSSVSVVVRRLVEQGLVRRRAATDDRRRRELELTAAGRRLVARSPTAGQVRLIDALRSLRPAELKTLSLLLEQVVQRMGAAEEPPTLFFNEPGYSPPRRTRRSRRRAANHNRARR